MKKELVIKRLEATIEKLKGLKESQFSYFTYVEAHDGQCGTTCCVAGWYPKWFPKSNLIWGIVERFNEVHLNTCNKVSVQDALMDYHGIDIDLIDALFYGHGYAFLNIKHIDSADQRKTTIKEVIERFQIVLEAIKSGKI